MGQTNSQRRDYIAAFSQTKEYVYHLMYQAQHRGFETEDSYRPRGLNLCQNMFQLIETEVRSQFAEISGEFTESPWIEEFAILREKYKVVLDDLRRQFYSRFQSASADLREMREKWQDMNLKLQTLQRVLEQVTYDESFPSSMRAFKASVKTFVKIVQRYDRSSNKMMHLRPSLTATFDEKILKIFDDISNRAIVKQRRMITEFRKKIHLHSKKERVNPVAADS